MTNTEISFDLKPKELPPFDFAGVGIQWTSYSYLAHQARFAGSLEELSFEKTFEEFRTLRHKFSWLSLTRPDACFTDHIASQITALSFSQKHIKSMNKFIRQVRETTDHGLGYHSWNLSTLRLVHLAIIDAPFGEQ